MTPLTLKLGTLLILVGVVSWLLTGLESPTALIPSFLGLPIVACGALMRWKPNWSVPCAHVAGVSAGLLLLGSLSRIPQLHDFGSIKTLSIWATALICLALVIGYAWFLFINRRGRSISPTPAETSS